MSHASLLVIVVCINHQGTLFWRQPAAAGTGPLFVAPIVAGNEGAEEQFCLFVLGEVNEAVTTAVDKVLCK